MSQPGYGYREGFEAQLEEAQPDSSSDFEMYIVYAVLMFISAVGGFFLSMSLVRVSERFQRLGNAHSAGLFLGVALCHMLDSAMDHFTTYVRKNDVVTDYPVVPFLVGLTFSSMVIFDMASTKRSERLTKRNSNGRRVDATELKSPSSMEQGSSSRTVDKPKNLWIHCVNMVLASLFIITSPIALLVSAAFQISQYHMMTFIVQSVACGTFLYMDFEAISTMRGHSDGHTCVHTIDETASRAKSVIAVLLMSCHAVFDGFAISSSKGTRAGVIAFAIIVHKFWVSIALGHELVKGMDPAVSYESKGLLGVESRCSPKGGGDKNASYGHASNWCQEKEDSIVFSYDVIAFSIGFGLMAAIATVM
eukprot:jgi/Bigna1/78516/fgenesh1_pg.55_\